MGSRLFTTAAAVADANGAATFNFGAPAVGFVWTGTVTVPGASAASTFTATIGSQAWGVWNGPAASPLLQAWEQETLVVTAAGLLPGSNYAATLAGTLDTDDQAQPIAPTVTVPLFTQRLLGSFTTVGDVGSFQVKGLQPSDAFLVFVPKPTTGIVRRGSTNAVVNGAASGVVAVPAGVVDGDVMVLAISTSGATSIPTPLGWTPIDNTSAGTAADPRLATFYRVAQAEPGNYTFALGAVTRSVMVIAAYTGVDTVNPVNAHNANNSGAASSVNVVANGVSPAAASTILVGAFAVASNSTVTPPAGMAEQQDQNAGTLITMEVADQLLTVAGATGTRTAVATAAGRWAGALVALTPSATARQGDPLELVITGVGSFSAGIEYGHVVLSSGVPAGCPVLPLVDNAVTVNWHTLITTRTLPANLDVYASAAPLPEFPLISRVLALTGGSAAIGTYTLLGADSAMQVTAVVMSIRGAGWAELRFAYNRAPTSTGTNPDFIEVGVVGGAAPQTTTLVWKPERGDVIASSQLGFMGGDAVDLVVGAANLDLVEVMVYGRDLLV